MVLGPCFHIHVKNGRWIFSTISKNSNVNLSELSSLLKRVRLQPGTVALPTNTGEVLSILRGRWKTVINAVGITEGEALTDVTASSLENVLHAKRDTLSYVRKDEILALLAGVNKSERASKRKMS